ncbi:MAG: hypothetical protein Q7K55_06970 [Candidatus Levybacteria bacterium]|nr:hypothetical protein [Candidatus Levybacteria bacterium]
MNLVEGFTRIGLGGLFTLSSPFIAEAASQNQRIVIDEQTLPSQTELVKIGDSQYRVTAESQINKTVKELNPIEIQNILAPELPPISDELVHFAPGENPSNPLITENGIILYSNIEFGNQYQKSTLYSVDPKDGDKPYPIAVKGLTNIAFGSVDNYNLYLHGDGFSSNEIHAQESDTRRDHLLVKGGDLDALVQAATDGETIIYKSISNRGEEIRGYSQEKGDFLIDPDHGYWQGKFYPAISGRIAVWQEEIQGRNGIAVRANIRDPYDIVERFVLPDTNLHMTEPSLSGNKLVAKVSDLKGPNSQVKILFADVKKRTAEYIYTDPNLFIRDVKIAGDWIVWTANNRDAEHAKSYVFALNHRTGQRFKIQHDDAYQPYLLPDPKDPNSAFVAYSRGTAYFGEKRELWLAKVELTQIINQSNQTLFVPLVEKERNLNDQYNPLPTKNSKTPGRK